MASFSSSKDFQTFLDNKQYSQRGILIYEKIFGRTYVSTGGESTTSKFCLSHLNLRPDMKVLDIGCGIGGSAFHMARTYGVNVYGVDLSTNMVELANNYRQEMTPEIAHRVQFHVDDATTMGYPEQFYDVVYSRDTILHIQDKLDLFKKFYKCLKPGGLLFITDYCRGDKEHSDAFKDYVNNRGYHLLTVPEYGKTLGSAGFSQVEATDNTDSFVDILKKELDVFKPMENEVVEEYGRKEYQGIIDGWENKIVRCGSGDQVWGLFAGKKLYG